MSYIYAHYTKDGRIYYIGKGIGDRAWTRISERKKSNYLWAKMYETHGLNYKILYNNLSEEKAYELESQLIAEERAKPNNVLTNITNGGDGFTGEFMKHLYKDPQYYTKIKNKNQRLAKDIVWLQKVKEAQNKRRKETTLISPIGEVVHVRGIREFAETHGLDSSSLRRVIKGIRNHHKGWKLYVSPSDIHKKFFKLP